MLRILCVSRRWLPLLVLLGVATACAADRLTSTGNLTEDEVVLAPTLAPLTAGQSTRLSARVARGGDTTVVTDVSWSSDNPSIATVSDGNLLTAVSTGSTWITADRRGRRGRSQVQVVGTPVSSVRVLPVSVTIIPGATATITATALDGTGGTINGRSAAWTTSDPSVATVSNGVVTAVSIGTASIVASIDGVTATSSVQVAPPAVSSIQVQLNSSSVAVGQQTTASAILRDASGNVLTGRSVGWGSSNTGIATVDANGIVRGVAVGTTTIVASSEGRTGSASVTVTPQVVTSISLTPSVVSMAAGQSATVSATLRDAGGNVVTGRQPTWTSASTAIASVNGSGTITGVAVGSTTVTASIDGASAPVSVTITAVGSPTVAVTPASASVVAGQTVQLAAAQRDASGNPMNTTFTWSTANASVATVNASGLVQGVASGTTTIVARSAENITASSTITVTPVPVASVTIAPTSLALVVGQTGALAATCRDAGGNALVGRSVTWSSSATGVATVDAVGGVRGVSAGGATITATCEGRTATAAVTVSLAPVASVTVTPGSSNLNVGATLQLAATLRDASGITLTGRTVTWSSSNTAAATVSASGVVTGVAAGTTTITATSEGRSGTSAITVQTPPPAGSNAYNNEPANMRFVIDAPFNSLTEGGWRPEAAHVDGRFGIGSDPTALRSPSSVLEFVYPTGFTSGGYSPGTVRAPAPFPDATGRQNIRELFWAFHFKANAGFQNHASNVNKLGYGWLNDATTFGIVWHWGRTQRPAADYMKQMAIFVSGNYFMFNTSGAFNVEPGSWYKVEVHFRPSSAGGVADGLVRVWVNDVLCADHPNVVTTAGFISDVYWSPTWGGMGGAVKAQTDYIWFDHTRISVR